MANKLKGSISVQDAMDNLSIVAGLNIENPPRIGIIKKDRIVTDDEELPIEQVQWLSEESPEPVSDVLDRTYRAIHQHLKHLYDSAEMNWDNEKTKHGIEALMAMVGDSAERIDAYFELRQGRPVEIKTSQREDFKALQHFYNDQFAAKFAGEDWVPSEKAELRDFNAVKADKEYELFYIRKEDGRPYYDPEVLRNLKLSVEFAMPLEHFEEDPLLKIRAMEDRDVHAAAGQMLHECHDLITEFYKIAHEFPGNDLCSSLNMAASALFLASNPKNLLQNTSGKSDLLYFNDFHYFLRRAMRTPEYQKLVAYPPDDSDKPSWLFLNLTHAFCRSLFERKSGIRQEAIGLIHRTMRRGEEMEKGKVKGDTVWTQFLLDDEKFRTLLANFPNGPLFKILDMIHESEDEDSGIPFDPIIQGNLPAKLYEIESKKQKIEILRIPCPTKQASIDKAEVCDEFKGFLRSLGKKSKHLLINLQDRTSWKEYARSHALEMMQKNAEFAGNLAVITLPKDTDFYHQINEYLKLDADDFIKVFIAQLQTPEECGYYFPPVVKQEEILQFARMALPEIHDKFFQKKKALTRRNREDFIEIFYQMLIFKCIEIIEPTSLSFTCKDAIDTGAAAQGIFYAFLQLQKGDFSNREPQDFLRWLLYAPALFIRERAIDPERLNRAISVIETIDKGLSEHELDLPKINLIV